MIRQSLAWNQQRLGGQDDFPVYVGFSGGLDSTTLLAACWHVLAQAGKRLNVLHARHGLHPEDSHWQQHCQQVCAQLGVNFISQELALMPGNIEAQARQARYDFFARHLPENALLLLAHHQHDQTETIVQRAFSGRGLLPMRVHGACGAGHFYRPWLQASATTFAEYLSLRQFEFGWIEDPSNTDQRFDRNFLRHGILPLVRERWPQLDVHLDRVAQTQQAQSAALQQTIRKLLDTDATTSLATSPTGTGRTINQDLLPDHAAGALAWLRGLVQAGFDQACSDRTLADFYTDLQRNERAAVLRVDADREVRCVAGRFHLLQRASYQPRPVCPEPGQTFPWRYGQLCVRVSHHTLGLKSEQTSAQTPEPASVLAARSGIGFFWSDGIEVRPRQGGETVPVNIPVSVSAMPLDTTPRDTTPRDAMPRDAMPTDAMKSGAMLPNLRKRAVKDLLHDARIPPWLRREYPLVYRGDELICVPGVWSKEQFSAPAAVDAQDLWVELQWC